MLIFKTTYPNGSMEIENVDDPAVTDVDGYINRKFGNPPKGEGFSVEIISAEQALEETGIDPSAVE